MLEKKPETTNPWGSATSEKLSMPDTLSYSFTSSASLLSHCQCNILRASVKNSLSSLASCRLSTLAANNRGVTLS